MPKKGIAPEFAVGNDLKAQSCLQVDGFVDRPVLDALELRIAEGTAVMARASLFEVIRPQKTSNDVAAVVPHHSLLIHD